MEVLLKRDELKRALEVIMEGTTEESHLGKIIKFSKLPEVFKVQVEPSWGLTEFPETEFEEVEVVEEKELTATPT